MSSYEPPAYGSAQPYGTPGYGQPPAALNYASWGARAGAMLLDTLIGLLAYIPVIIGLVLLSSTSSVAKTVGGLLLALGFLLAIGFVIWNHAIRQGSTGQTIGKGVLKIRLIGEATGSPIGGGMCLARMFVHAIDSAPCYIGWLWPLWDAKKQTFADKVLKTVVVRA